MRIIIKNSIIVSRFNQDITGVLHFDGQRVSESSGRLKYRITNSWVHYRVGFREEVNRVEFTILNLSSCYFGEYICKM